MKKLLAVSSLFLGCNINFPNYLILKKKIPHYSALSFSSNLIVFQIVVSVSVQIDFSLQTKSENEL
jgi:hypothetical protein